MLALQYEYVMDAKFLDGSSSGDDTITCRIANAILQPWFEMSAVRWRACMFSRVIRFTLIVFFSRRKCDSLQKLTGPVVMNLPDWAAKKFWNM
jgi:hypothetical protein